MTPVERRKLENYYRSMDKGKLKLEIQKMEAEEFTIDLKNVKSVKEFVSYKERLEYLNDHLNIARNCLH